MGWRLFAVTVAIVVFGAWQVGCGSKSSGNGCDSTTCGGCCDGNGKCQSAADATCGVNGEACVACNADTHCNTAVGGCQPVGASGSTGSSASGSGGAVGGTSAGSVSGGETSAGSSGANGSSSGTSGACGANSCSYDNDCGGSRSCYNGCCVDTAETCLHGAAAFGPCAPGWEPDEGGHCCELADGGTGGTSAGSGSTGGTGGTTGGFVCQFDGGVSGGICNPDCPSGFHCSAGACVLNGGNGPIQVTLRFDTHTDLDLHVVEPSGCEVYYGNPTGCAGSLDLDANAGCSTSSVDAENVIYPPLDGGFTPPSGTYTVRVDDWENCSSLATIPFEVIVRHNGQTDTYCEGFGDPAGSGTAPDDHGGAGDGRTIATFTYP